MTDIIQDQASAWRASRARLIGSKLVQSPSAWLALAAPGKTGFWFGKIEANRPVWMPTADTGEAVLAEHLLRSRGDIGAVLAGCGLYGQTLFHNHGRLPPIGDTQVRHLGPMQPAGRNDIEHLDKGGNVHWLAGQPLVLGMTAAHLVRNAELFEAWARVYILAAATGECLQPLPWWARWNAYRQLRNDQKAAAAQIQRGQLPAQPLPY